MAGYHDIVMPPEFSQGSEMQVGFDTRITTLENGVETRMSKYRPEGRRTYSVLRGIASGALVQQMYRFFILRQGALNSFKFKDWMDYATTLSGEVFSDDSIPVSEFDSPLPVITGRTYQMVKVYQDTARTITRTIVKVKPNTEKIAANGVLLTGGEYTINYETGLVDIDPSVGVIASLTGGCQFYVVVRFAESTDEQFTVAMQATNDTQSLPGFDLIEDVAPASVSQDYQYGGSHFYLNVTGEIRIVEVQGRLQSFLPTDANLVLRLPPTFNIPTGGPIFVLHNAGPHTITIANSTGSTIITAASGQIAQLFLTTASGSDIWIATL
jgi:uncharacterized protein (TIGR02217 family)